MKLLLFFAPIYGLAFIAMFAIRRVLWLALALPAALVLIFLLVTLGTQGMGEAGLGPYLMGVVAAIGFASGTAARLTLLALRWGDSRRRTAAVGLLFLCGVPLTLRLWGYLQQREAQRRYAPPSMACRSRLHEVRLGDRTLRLPMLWGMTASTKRDLS